MNVITFRVNSQVLREAEEYLQPVFSLKRGSAAHRRSMKCNEPHPLTSIKYARVRERSINQQGFTRAATCTFISLPLALSLSGRSRWLAAEKDHDQAWTLIAQHLGTNTRWATVFHGRKIFLGISLSTIVRGVLSLACCVPCVSSTTRSSETA